MKMIWIYDRNKDAMKVGIYFFGVDVSIYTNDADPGVQVRDRFDKIQKDKPDFFVEDEVSFEIDNDGLIENKGIFFIKEQRILWTK